MWYCESIWYKIIQLFSKIIFVWAMRGCGGLANGKTFAESGHHHTPLYESIYAHCLPLPDCKSALHSYQCNLAREGSDVETPPRQKKESWILINNRYASLKLYPVTLAESMQELFSRVAEKNDHNIGSGTNWRVQTSDIKAVLHSSNVLTNTVKEQILLWIPSNFLCLFKRNDRRQAVFDILGEGRTIFDTTVSVVWTE